MSHTTKNCEDHRFELGALMKNLRLENEKTLEFLRDRTKIPLQTLIFMEEGDASFFKERLYSRGFISVICKELKVDPAPFLDKLDYCESKEDSSKNLNPTHETCSSPLKTGPSSTKKALIFSFLILLCLTGALVYKGFSEEKIPPSEGILLKESTQTTP